MARQEYFVIKQDSQWKIRHNGQLSAALPTQGEAIMEAVERAHIGPARQAMKHRC